MDEVPISVFKARCLRILAQVGATGRPVLVTRFGHAVALVGPPALPPPRRLGGGVGTGKILGDIVGPISDVSDWDAARPKGDLPPAATATRRAAPRRPRASRARDRRAR